MLMQDLLRQWWMGHPKNNCHAQTQPHQASRQLEHLVGPRLGTWNVLHHLRTCENGCASYEHQCGAQKAQMSRRVLEREVVERWHLEEEALLDRRRRDLEGTIDPTMPKTLKGLDVPTESECTAH